MGMECEEFQLRTRGLRRQNVRTAFCSPIYEINVYDNQRKRCSNLIRVYNKTDLFAIINKSILK